MAEYNFQTFKQMNLCSAWVTEFALVFQINKYVTVTETDFVSDNKTVR